MDIHLARDGASLGIFTAEDVRAGLTDGRFRRDDLAWCAGMPTWKPLRDWPEFMSAAMNETHLETATTAPSQIPWEVSPSPRTLLQSVWRAFTQPDFLTTGRFTTSSAFSGAYLAIAFAALPLVLLAVLNSFQEQAQVAALMEFASRFNPDFADLFNPEELSRDPEALALPALLAGCAALCLLVIFPLLGVLAACISYPGLWLVGARPAFSRTVNAAILLSGWYVLASLPLNLGATLLGLIDPVTGIFASLLTGLVMVVLLWRALAASLRCAFWQVMMSYLIPLLLCCGCIFCFAALAAGVEAAIS